MSGLGVVFPKGEIFMNKGRETREVKISVLGTQP